MRSGKTRKSLQSGWQRKGFGGATGCAFFCAAECVTRFARCANDSDTRGEGLMSLKLVIAGLVLAMAGMAATAHALDARIGPMGPVLKAGKAGSAVIEVRRRSRAVETRPTAPE